MNKEFIPYEQALELKELGFDEECMAMYHLKKIDGIIKSELILKETNINISDVFTRTPLYQQAFRWFREKYELVSWVSLGSQNSREYIFGILTDSTFIGSYNTNFSTHEEAELACLKKLIEIVKNK